MFLDGCGEGLEGGVYHPVYNGRGEGSECAN